MNASKSFDVNVKQRHLASNNVNFLPCFFFSFVCEKKRNGQSKQGLF